VQKTASLYFCTPEELNFFAETECAKNRFALFLHSGRIKFFAETECLKTKQGVAA